MFAFSGDFAKRSTMPKAHVVLHSVALHSIDRTVVQISENGFGVPGGLRPGNGLADDRAKTDIRAPTMICDFPHSWQQDFSVRFWCKTY